MKKNIEVDAFNDPAGNPTCSIGHFKGGSCIFLRVGVKGETCIFAKHTLKSGKYLETMKLNNSGYPQPLEQCPIWNKK